MISELKDTVDMMLSPDYKERFRAEYFQLKIRLEKLQAMLQKWDAGQLNFQPSVPREYYDFQVRCMEQYLSILEFRAAKYEGVNLEDHE